MIKFPKHFVMHITHNEHKNYYRPVLEYLDECQHRSKECNPEELAKMLTTDEIWEIQWYPPTPISFNYVIASTFERALELMWEIENGDET